MFVTIFEAVYNVKFVENMSTTNRMNVAINVV